MRTEKAGVPYGGYVVGRLETFDRLAICNNLGSN